MQHVPDMPAMRADSIFRNISIHKRIASLQSATAACQRQSIDREIAMAFNYSRDAGPTFENKVKNVALVGVSTHPVVTPLDDGGT